MTTEIVDETPNNVFMDERCSLQRYDIQLLVTADTDKYFSCTVKSAFNTRGIDSALTALYKEGEKKWLYSNNYCFSTS